MAAPMFFIVWGTKVRVRPVGTRADYCPGCLHLSQFTMKSVQVSKHLYYIPLGYHEQSRIKECTICGGLFNADSNERCSACDDQSFETLLTETNPALTADKVAAIEAELDAKGGSEARRERALQYFLEKQNSVLTDARKQVGFLTFLTLVACLAPIICAFAEGGPTWGFAAMIMSVGMLLFVQRWDAHRQAAKVIKPRLVRFLGCKHFPFDDLERHCAGNGSKFSRLCRHFATGRYDDLRR